jgi:copper chaperone CopZ
VTVRPGLCLLLAGALLLGACAPAVSKVEARGLPPVTVVASANDEVTVNVLEMICQTCAEHIIAGCRRIEGVASVDADRKERTITLHFDSSLITREGLLAAVDDVVSSIP